MWGNFTRKHSGKAKKKRFLDKIRVKDLRSIEKESKSYLDEVISLVMLSNFGPRWWKAPFPVKQWSLIIQLFQKIHIGLFGEYGRILHSRLLNSNELVDSLLRPMLLLSEKFQDSLSTMLKLIHTSLSPFGATKFRMLHRKDQILGMQRSLKFSFENIIHDYQSVMSHLSETVTNRYSLWDILSTSALLFSLQQITEDFDKLYDSILEIQLYYSLHHSFDLSHLNMSDFLKKNF